MALTELMRQMTGKTDLETHTSYTPRALPPAKTPPPVPAVTGRSLPAYASGGASDMTETSRELYAEHNVFSSDGIFSIAFKPLKRLNLDSGGFIEFKDPLA
jgi:hypothetical protein